MALGRAFAPGRVVNLAVWAALLACSVLLFMVPPPAPGGSAPSPRLLRLPLLGDAQQGACYERGCTAWNSTRSVAPLEVLQQLREGRQPGAGEGCACRHLAPLRIPRILHQSEQ